VKTTRLIVAACLLILVGFSADAAAIEQTLRLDPAGARVSFHLDATMHSANGTLALKRGEIRFDLATGAAAGEIVIDATSADTDHKGRDEKLHHEVLESATFPEIAFWPTAIKSNLDEHGAGTVTLAGTVTIHGGSHDVSLSAVLARDGEKVRATGKLVVPYVAWGMHDPSVFVLRVAKVVEVSFTAVGALAAMPPTPAPAPEAGR
jgi:polyisoprenoid-binding protein YceI